VTGRQATLAHEAAHVVGGLLAGHRIKSVRLGPSKKDPGQGGNTVFDLEGSPEVDLYGHLIAVLMGPMAEGHQPPQWPPPLHPDVSDSLATARLINHLALTKGDYDAAVAIASHWLHDPMVKAAIARVATALGQHGELDDRMVREALGPHLLAWLARTTTDREELAA
jgi:hypothetical protein